MSVPSRFTGRLATAIGKPFVGGLSRRITRFYNPGTPIWDDEWDILLVLDTCRVDLLQQVADEYTFLPDPDTINSRWSVASMSEQWIERTFSETYASEISKTAYITGNPLTNKAVFAEIPVIIDEVWESAWDDNLNTIPPRPLTDRAINTWRERSNKIESMIVHYMQPHAPFIPDPDLGDYADPEDFGEGFTDIWHQIGDELTRKEIWAAYRENLRYVLDDVELLLENVDTERVVITADHGNAIGEFGQWGHPWDVLLPCIRNVPWVVTSGEDTQEYQPEIVDNETRSIDKTDVDKRLDALAYK